jgi:hypothetical protein
MNAVASRSLAIIVVCVAALSALAVYLYTLAVEVGERDAAELALRAWQLGATHPPGSPGHTVLGFVFTRFIDEPAVATNLLSAISTALAVGVLAWLLLRLTRDPLISVVGALLFGLLHQIWLYAVTTEVYALNIACLSLAIAGMLVWVKARDKRALVFVSLVYGFSVTVYFGNLMLLPAFILPMLWVAESKARTLAIFIAIVAIFVCCAAAANLLLAANHAPLGTGTRPDSISHLLRYMSASDYRPTQLHSLDFYLARVVEHGLIFSRLYLYIGVPVGLYGLWLMWHTERVYCTFLLAIFTINFGFFTAYEAADYYTMVNPAYFVYTVWVAYGAWRLGQDARTGALWTMRTVFAALVGMLFVTQITDFRDWLQESRQTEYAQAVFKRLPEDALVVAPWRIFPTLLYFQQVHGQRPDLTLIISVAEPRNYDHGRVNSFVSYVEQTVNQRPVAVARAYPELQEDFDLSPVSGLQGWYLLNDSRPNAAMALPGD